MVAPGPADQLRAGPGLNAIRAATGEEARLIAAPQRAQRTRRKAQGLSGAVDTAGSCTTQKAWTLLWYARNRASGNLPSPANQQPCNPAGPEWAFSMRSVPSAGNQEGSERQPGKGPGLRGAIASLALALTGGGLRPPPVSCASSGRRIRNWSWTTACGRAGIPWPRCRPCRAGTCAGSRAFAARRVRSAVPRGGYRNGSR